MINILDVHQLIKDAKKKYDKDKYIEVLEQQIDALTTHINRIEPNLTTNFEFDKSHAQVYKNFKEQDCFYEKDLKGYITVNGIDEIVMYDLIDEQFFIQDTTGSAYLDYQMTYMINPVKIREALRMIYALGM